MFFLVSCDKEDYDIALDEDYYHSDALEIATKNSFGNDLSYEDTNDGRGQELTLAGEWNDLENWDFWKNLCEIEKYYTEQIYWGFYPENRYSVVVKDANGNFIVDAPVKLLDKAVNIIWESKTDNRGRAELWDGMFGVGGNAGDIIIEYNNTELHSEKLHKYENGVIECVVKDISIVPNTIDISFVIDATGSMEEEISFLQNNLKYIINNIMLNEPELKIRLGATFYRDRGEEYIVRHFPLSAKIDDVIQNIQEQSANGGGDTPEALDEALKTTIIQGNWSEKSCTRILFLILDAPPHYSAQYLEEIHNYIYKASEKGIKIIPIAAPGVDVDTEFLLRFMAMATNGTYTFITNPPENYNQAVEPTVGNFQVEYLQNLIERLILKYCYY